MARRAEFSAGEHGAVEGRLAAMIAHWHTLGRTSVAGLRETFLQRPGALTYRAQASPEGDRADASSHLMVEPRAFDMLLDAIPWSYKILRLPWMPEVLHVEWR